MNTLFLMDPIEGINPHKDSTYMFMLAAKRVGDKIWIMGKNDISIYPNHIQIYATSVQVNEDRKNPWKIGKKEAINASNFDILFVRTDPPFNDSYLLDTWLLDLLPPHIFILNKPQALRGINEKLWATQFKEWTPETLVSRYKTDVKQFLEKHPKIIGKPLNGFGGAQVFQIQKEDKNTPVIIETLTKNETQMAIFQRYIPQASEGDKRILLLNGNPLGAILRVHNEEDHRNNFYAGGKAFPTSITSTEDLIINELKPHLQKHGLYFVGIDIIGEKLIEINVTSPTCIQEMNAAYGVHLEEVVYKFAQDQARKRIKK